MTRPCQPAVLLVVALHAGGCRSPEPASGTGPESLRHVTVGLPVAAATFLPLYVGEEAGLFREEGLEVEFLAFRGGSDLVRAVVAGSIDVGVTALAGVTVGIAAGQPLRAFFAGYNIPAFAWYAVDGIASMDDVRGKRLGVTRYGSSTDFLTRYALVSRGIAPDRDVQIVQGGDSPTRLAAMAAGQLDVNIFNPPETYVAEERGYHRILSQRDLADDYPFHVFFATEQAIAGQADLIRALLRAHVRAVRLARSDRALALDVLARRAGVSAEHAGRAYDEFMPYVFEDGRLPSRAGLDLFFDMGIEAGQFTERWPLDRFWTPVFVDSFDEWRP